jgi:uncharacterized protein (DUF433 family)
MDDEALIRQCVVPAPGSADRATVRLRGREFPLWMLIRDLKAAKGHVLQVAADHDLLREAVLAARSYYLQHAAEIDARIRAAARSERDALRAA